MRKLAVIAALAVTLSVAKPRPAEAGCGLGCPPWVDALAYVFLAGVIGAYGYGIGYYVEGDLSDREHDRGYYGGELALHGTFGILTGALAVTSIDDGNYGTAAISGALAITHTTLAINGGRGLWRTMGDIDLPKPSRLDFDDVKWPLALTYGATTLIFLAAAPGEHSRNYGIAEAAVNGTFALGLGYLAIDRARDGHGGKALLYGGFAALSSGLAIHGLRTALSPAEPKGIDLLGTDLVPTVVDDGVQQGMGLGTSGTW